MSMHLMCLNFNPIYRMNNSSESVKVSEGYGVLTVRFRPETETSDVSGRMIFSVSKKFPVRRYQWTADGIGPVIIPYRHLIAPLVLDNIEYSYTAPAYESEFSIPMSPGKYYASFYASSGRMALFGYYSDDRDFFAILNTLQPYNEKNCGSHFNKYFSEAEMERNQYGVNESLRCPRLTIIKDQETVLVFTSKFSDLSKRELYSGKFEIQYQDIRSKPE